MNKLYKYKDKEYRVVREDFQMKCPKTREWLDSVMYEQLETGLIFVREAKEFYKLFV